MSDLAIATEGLSRRYGRVLAVEDLRLQVRRGEIYGFLGANGAGKTTTMLMLLGIVAPDRGTIRLFGRDLAGKPLALKRQVGAVSENQYLYPGMTTVEYLRFFADLYHVYDPRRRIGQVLDVVGLSARAGAEARTLSRGLQQKLGLARALLHDPPLLVLDEPISGLDPLGVREVRQILLHENARGKTIFLSSHVLSEIERIAHRVGVLVDGRLVADGTLADLRGRLEAMMTLELERANDDVVAALAALPCVGDVRAHGSRLHVTTVGGGDHRADVSGAVGRAGGVIVGMNTKGSSLEDAFVALAAPAHSSGSGRSDQDDRPAPACPRAARVTVAETAASGTRRVSRRSTGRWRAPATGVIAWRELTALRRSPLPAVALGVALVGAAVASRSVAAGVSAGGVVAGPSPLYVPLFIAVLVLTAVLAFVSATSVARERESGTLETLFYGPVDVTAFVTGKFAGLVVVYLALCPVVALALLALASLTSLRVGPDLLLGVLLSTFAAAHTIAFGLALGALCASVRSAVMVLVAVAWVTLAVHGAAAILAALPAGGGAATSVAATFDSANRALSLVSPYAHLDWAVQAARIGDLIGFAVAVLASLACIAGLLAAALLGLRWRGAHRS